MKKFARKALNNLLGNSVNSVNREFAPRLMFSDNLRGNNSERRELMIMRSTNFGIYVLRP